MGKRVSPKLESSFSQTQTRKIVIFELRTTCAIKKEGTGGKERRNEIPALCGIAYDFS